MKSVNVVYRSRLSGISIRKVFDSFVPLLEGDFRIRRLTVPEPGAGPRALARNFRECLRAPRAGVNHVSGDVHYCVLAFARRTTVLTVHDMGVYLNYRGFKRWLRWLVWVWLPVRYARRVVCVSPYTAGELREAVRIDESKLSVIANPVGREYVYSPKEFAAARPLILHVGTAANKNLPRVALALNGIPCRLRIIGQPDAEALAALESSGVEYSTVGGIPPEQMVEEYRACDVVSFPSLYEGFGMPIVEGQAVGRAVVTSDLEPMRLVAGDGAILVDPFDVESIRAGFLRCIRDEGARRETIARGVENAARFSRERTAAEYAKIYAEL